MKKFYISQDTKESIILFFFGFIIFVLAISVYHSMISKIDNIADAFWVWANI